MRSRSDSRRGPGGGSRRFGPARPRASAKDAPPDLVISMDDPAVLDTPPFSTFDLKPALKASIAALGWTKPTPIQNAVIPEGIAGRDVMGCSETGSGKTAAFLIPILNRLAGGPKGLRALVLEPTRELAIQVKEVADKLAAGSGLTCGVIFGGIKTNSHASLLRRGVDLLVATPGRLIDLTWQGELNFNGIEALVIDEVDRMFDMGFIDDVRAIISYLPADRPYQKMGFSATLAPEVRALLDPIMREPFIVTIGRTAKAAEGITQKLYCVRRDDKVNALIRILKREKPGPTLVFTETKLAADKVYKDLRRAGFNVKGFHSGFTQEARFDILRNFREGRVQMLVATNVAARGLDIRGITHIINFDVPRHCEDYVHRIGRSARGEATGTAISIASDLDLPYLRRIEELIKEEIPLFTLEGFAPAPIAARLGRKPRHDDPVAPRPAAARPEPRSRRDEPALSGSLCDAATPPRADEPGAARPRRGGRAPAPEPARRAEHRAAGERPRHEAPAERPSRGRRVETPRPEPPAEPAPPPRRSAARRGGPAAAPAAVADRRIVRGALIPEPPEALFRRLTSREGLRTFLAPEAKVGALRPGEPFELHFSPDAPAGERGTEGCRLLSYLPGQMLSFEWANPPHLAGIRHIRTWVVIGLAPSGAGATQATLIHLGFGAGREWDEAFAYFERTWPLVLARLARAAAGTPMDWKNPWMG